MEAQRAEENILILGEKNLARVAEIRGAYISDAVRSFLQADTNTILAEWQRQGFTTDNSVRENISRAYFTVDSKHVFTPEFTRELAEKKGPDWKEFYPDVYALANATPFLHRLDEKYRPHVLSFKPLFEEFDSCLQEFMFRPTSLVQEKISSYIPRFTSLGMRVSFIQFEHRLSLQDGKQIKAEEAKIFYQQYTNFRSFFLHRFNIPVHGLVFHNAPLATGVKTVMDTFSSNYTLWNENNLVCFPTDHILCPKIRIMDAQERKDFYEEQGTEGSKQLLQHSTDPISKIYRLVPGDLIEITRDLAFLKMPSEQSIAYRYIING